VAQSEIEHAILEGTTCRDLVRELGRSPPVDSNELFDIATSFASTEEAVGAIFDGKKGKRVDDAPAEGSGSKEPQQKHKWGNKGKKPRREAHAPGRDNDGDEALAVDPARRGPREAPRGPSVFDDMLKKPCPYHKTPVNHTLEQCDLLKRYYSRAATKDGEAKKDGGDGDAGGFLAVENVFLIFWGQPWTCLLTPKFGKESDGWVQLGKESVWWKDRIFSDVFGKEVCGRLSAPVRQRNSRADFAGLDSDVAQAGRANGWIGNQA
jgi:hypothetical protein